MKKIIKAGLSDSEKTHFKFSAKEFEQLDWKNDKEFMLGGEMYDMVSSTHFSTDSLSITCINDKQESELFGNLSEYIDQNTDLTATGKPISKVLLKLLKINCLLTSEHQQIPLVTGKVTYSNISIITPNSFTKVSTPPPESFCS